ncbi:hypothetical protein VB712_09180 [Spirulina sp. CCNP1310]|uniref:hypothetical protein n=1 Tax=Spirulina sp. CCNP1310 TaxID=3110249 RepID=UPI002B21A564|nr:hypothetical protein [Spirulina sp. CCNP1310]MEA5419399.1 hypothetical protein [Spirulina sp. CCNP1310]
MLDLAGLMARYGLTRRSQLDERLEAVGETLHYDPQVGDYADVPLVQHLDDLDRWLRQGKSLGDYTAMGKVRIISSVGEEMRGGAINVAPVADLVKEPENPLTPVVITLSEALAAQTPTPVSPLQVWRELEEACSCGWILSTSQIRTLTGITPYGDVYEYGAFRFKRNGKIGREAAWEVWKSS